jgi:predicted DNA-binding transcriptional regulator AlpA
MTEPTPTTAAPSGRLWTAQDVAAYLTVPIATLYQWRYLGTGPTADRVGRHLRYEPAAIQAWLNQHANRSNGPKKDDHER